MTDSQPEIEETRMSLGEHLEELRRRVIYALVGVAVTTAVCLLFGGQILDALRYSYRLATEQEGVASSLAVLNVTGGLATYLRVSLYAGLVLASPWVFYQLWSFVAAGLYPHEKKYIRYAVPASVILFVLGACFFLLQLSVPTLRFFIGFNKSFQLQQIITLDEHIAFMINLALVFGLTFQTPLVVVLLAKMGLVSIKTFNKYRKHVIAGIAVFSGLMAPPDLLSMLAMGLPMWLLYELGILLAWVLVYKKQPAEELE